MQPAGARTKCTAEGSEWVQRAVKRFLHSATFTAMGEKSGAKRKERKPLHLNLFGETRWKANGPQDNSDTEEAMKSVGVNGRVVRSQKE